MKNDISDGRISAALARLAAEDAELSPPAYVEKRLLAQLESRHAISQTRSPFWALAMAAPIILAFAVLHGGGSSPAVRDEPFYQMPYVAAPAPYERTEVRRETVPVSALIAAGLDVHVPDSSAVVTADVLFGQDGRALAIRLVRLPGPINTRRIEP